jgi:hypothetical protein
MDADDRKREILSAVARGDLSPQEAAEQLHALDQPPEPDPAPLPPSGAGHRPGSVRIGASLRKVEVVGDPSVREAVADGAHRAWRDGDTLVIESEPGDEDDEDDDDVEFFRYGRPFGFSSVGRHRVRFGRYDTLRVRMNPDLPLEARVEAGALSVRDVRSPIRARVSAGSAKLDGFAAPLDVEVAAGGFKARGRLDRGQSRVRCDAGSVKLHLEAGSSVAVRGEAHLGAVDIAGRRTQGMFNEATSVTVGSGAGSLDIECNLGSVKVTSDV